MIIDWNKYWMRLEFMIVNTDGCLDIVKDIFFTKLLIELKAIKYSKIFQTTLFLVNEARPIKCFSTLVSYF